MKRLNLILLFFLLLTSCAERSNKNFVPDEYFNEQIPDTSDMTNNFYDNTTTYSLPVSDLIIEGEIENPGKVDLKSLPLHSVIVKETILNDKGGDTFIGAYRYDGYSLFDILDKSIIKKSNLVEFNPIIDLYVEIENEKGESVVFSWGEIYYPVNLHKILIASSVSRIVPSKTKDLWSLPSTSKLIAGNDLITERNISSPVKITVRSYPKSFVVNTNLSPLYSKEISLYKSSGLIRKIDKLPGKPDDVTFNTIFYGRGRGIHSTSPFAGKVLKDLLKEYFPVSQENLRSGIMCFAGMDGYRCAVSYSELFNRNDQQEYLLIETTPDEEGGLFRIFPAADFFSDRAIKAVNSIHLGY